MNAHTIHLREVDSTNRYLLDCCRMAADDDPLHTADVVVVVADYQTAGRGQGSNTWESEPCSNLLCSLMVHPEGVEARQQFILSMAGALALYDTLSPTVDSIRLKWPNDVYWHDCKLSGTLIQTTLHHSHIDACVYGIGLNVNQTELSPGVPNAVSLRQILGKHTPVEGWLKLLTDSLWQRVLQVNAGCYDDIRREYHAALYRNEGMHAYKDGNGIFRAETIGVEDDGHLLLHDEYGRDRRYAFKEVEFLL